MSERTTSSGPEQSPSTTTIESATQIDADDTVTLDATAFEALLYTALKRGFETAKNVETLDQASCRVIDSTFEQFVDRELSADELSTLDDHASNANDSDDEGADQT